MNLSWLEIGTLYLVAASQAAEIVQLGCVYHSISGLMLGTLLVLYAVGKAVWSFRIWWRLI